MPESTAIVTTTAERKLDRKLLLSLALSPLAAGASTIVGFIVAHWITITAYKRMGYMVATISFLLCAISAELAWSAKRSLSGADETIPEEGRRLFMAKLALLLSVLCAFVVLAGTLVLITLRPGD
jgi:hypothetical protein